MTTHKKKRATILVDWSHTGIQGVLVHADSYKNTWILPGGGLEQYGNGKTELAISAAVRELYEETTLVADAITALFPYTGAFRAHDVFHIRVQGALQIVDPKEAPAFGVCGPDFHVTPIMWVPGYTTDHLTLASSSKTIINRYWESYRHIRASTSVTKTSVPTVKSETTRLQIDQSTVELVVGSIVSQDVDAVVNAANTGLTNGSGVSGALHRGAGAQELEAACRAIGGCPTGEARITPGFKLKAHHIIHAVGPIYTNYSPKQAATLLAGAYRSSLELAHKHQFQSIAFPSLSTGVYGYPVEDAARIATQTIAEYLSSHQGTMEVRVIVREDTRAAFEAAFHSFSRR